MKLYLKLASFAVGSLLWWGVLIPGLISASDDILLAGGVLAIIAYPAIAYKLFATEIKNVKSKMENL
jgi:hypothetical protein